MYKTAELDVFFGQEYVRTHEKQLGKIPARRLLTNLMDRAIVRKKAKEHKRILDLFFPLKETL